MYRDSDRTLSGERVSTRRLSGRPRASWVATPLARCAHVRPAHLAMRRARPQRAESSSDALLASLLHSLHVAKSIRELAVKQYTLMNPRVAHMLPRTSTSHSLHTHGACMARAPHCGYACMPISPARHHLLSTASYITRSISPPTPLN
jgi:hypothetical protein